MALNAPLFLILLYLLPLLSLVVQLYAERRWFRRLVNGEVLLSVAMWAVAAALVGAGLALLGAAYLHDVWYC